jgi:hypothetical protein
MALDDYLEPEVAVAVAVTAAVASPKARRIMRQGAVYGLAGILKAGDGLAAFGRGVGRGMQQAASASGEKAAAAADEASDASSPAARARNSRARTEKHAVEEPAP